MDPVAGVAPKLEATAAAFVKEHRLPGAAVAVVHGNELAWWAGVGFADVGEARRPDASSLYLVASITKTFTGTAIMQLRDEGRLHLDDPAVSYLPELATSASPFGAIETVTIRRMLSHESGMQMEPPDTDWAVPAYEGRPERNLARAAEFTTAIPPNRQQKYSNLAYQLLGEIVARVSGTAYVDYVHRNILGPLGMEGSGFEPLPDPLLARKASGYAARSFSDELSLASAPPVVWAEGGLWSCLSDLARWLSFQFREDGGPRAGTQIIAGETLREMHAARYLGDEAWTEAFCISWYAIRLGDAIWVQHSGGLNGFITNVCFDPKERVGAIVLLNGIGPAHELAMDLATIARDAIREAVTTIEPPVPTPPVYADLLGLYVEAEQALVLRLEWRDGALLFLDAENEKWRPILVATEERDVFLVAPGVQESGERAVFRRGPDGRVSSVFLGATSLRRFGPVERP